MARLLPTLFDDMASDTKAKVIAIYALILVFNLGVWIWALAMFRRYPAFLGTAFLACSLGLRHAVDADHIAAIDNVTRKFMQEGKRPVAVGLMFSLGHSTIVAVGSIAISAAALALHQWIDVARIIGGVIGTLISAVFLFLIGIANSIVLLSIVGVFRRALRGESNIEEDSEVQFEHRGFLTGLLHPIFYMIRSSWHMYPLGILFGLGFDTATEIGLLGLSATEASKGLSLWSILIFPALFAGGMTLVDTTDNILMLGAYGWAFAKPVRKLYYNITMTLISVVAAFAVGGIEVLSLLSEQLNLRGTIWRSVDKLSRNFGLLGCLIVALFLLSWVVSVAVYKWRRFDDLEMGPEA